MTPARLSLQHVPASWRRPLHLAPLLLWLAADAVVPDMGFARDSMRLAVDVAGWHWPGWGWLPTVTVLLIAGRGALGAERLRMQAAWSGVINVLAWIALPTILLLALRAMSLWGPVGAVLPWLGLAWSPHASVALALTPFLGGRDRPAAIRQRTAAILFVVFLAVFGAYTLYICQMVMIHGDEAQYLRVTQSLLHDGDIDLTNNLSGDVTEFHVMDVGVHRAPGSPDGKIYSKHPVGLSLLLVPAYEVGLQLWENPRLGAALALAACAAAIVALLFLWLCHVGFPSAVSMWVTLACATTTPLLLFSTQIYPELPTVLVTLVVLLRLDSRWLRSGSGTVGAQSPLELGALSLLVGLLPFLHPRYAPLAGLLGLGLVWQAKGSAERRKNLSAVFVVGIFSVANLVIYNLSISDDWLGNFRPGNAWDEDALSPGTWLMSLPGHWIHLTKGLAINSPWYFVAMVPGVAALAASRDRRLLAAVALYATTAVVNGIHPEWTFGFCLPARFVVTALPALALCAAAGLQAIRPSRWLGVLLCGALAVSWDAVSVAVQIPELAYQGEHLPRIALAGFYPFGVHGFSNTLESVPLPDLLLWAIAAIALAAIALPDANLPPWLRHRLAVAAVVTLALLSPALWGLADTSTARLRRTVSPYLKILTDDIADGSTTLHSTFSRLREGQRLEDGTFAADEGQPAGTLAAYYMPIQVPGLYRVVVSDAVADGTTHTAYVSHQRLLPALQPWTKRLRIPIRVGSNSTFRFDYYLDRLEFGYLHFIYSGTGRLQVGGTTQDFHALVLPLRLQEAARFDFRHTAGPHAARDNLEPGRYQARFRIAGGALSTLTQRQPTPVKMAVVVTDGADVPFQRLQPWYDSPRRLRDITGSLGVQPQREVIAAPWWTSLPVVGDDVYQMSFIVRQAGLVWFLFQYDGPADLDLEEIVVYSQQLEMD